MLGLVFALLQLLPLKLRWVLHVFRCNAVHRFSRHGHGVLLVPTPHLCLTPHPVVDFAVDSGVVALVRWSVGSVDPLLNGKEISPPREFRCRAVGVCYLGMVRA